jgi:leucyl aminopeptidase (aminopeptidase T)
MLSPEVAAEITTKVCLGVKSHERFLIVTDTETSEIGKYLLDAGLHIGAETILIVIKPRTRHGEEPPEPVSEALGLADVFVAPTKFSLSHTQARKRATEKGVRGATMPGITMDMFLTTLSADYEKIRDFNQHLKKMLEGKRTIRITTELGTDLTLSIEGRTVMSDDGLIHEKGSFGNLPAGEVFVAPVEGSANGILVIDASVAGIGILERPIEVTVENGFATKIEGSNQGEKLQNMLSSVGMREAFNMAELGFGTNPNASVIGNVLEDEKAFGTIHIAFGDNSTIGGLIKAGIHVDAILTKPTVSVDGEFILKNGIWTWIP